MRLLYRLYRSAKTGRFVTAAYAKKHPSTTVCETWRLRRTERKNVNPITISR